ncbi:MAG: Wzz/FepE/Etk N-terminal domain-containing protein [Burkholderiales bacterium]|nr:Wzz/FepE/Etk N-terminal domain-containing protein [Burkholderiales bacterium]
MPQFNHEIDLSKIILVLKSHWKIIAKFTCCTTFIAILYCIFATPIFTAVAIINPPNLNNVGNQYSNVISSANALDVENNSSTQKSDSDIVVAILNTKTVNDIVINKFNLIKELDVPDIEKGREKLNKIVNFTPDLKSGFIAIEVSYKDPKLAALIANYYIIALGQVIDNSSYAIASHNYIFYQTQANLALSFLNQSESKLNAFVKKYGVLAGSQIGVVSNVASELQAQLIGAQTELKSMEYTLSKDNPDYKEMQAKVNTIREQIESLNDINIDNNLGIKTPQSMSSELAYQYINLVRDVKFKELIYDGVLKQKKAAQLNMFIEQDPLTVQVIDPAQTPLHKSKPKRLLIILLTFIISVILISFYVLVKNKSKL